MRVNVTRSPTDAWVAQQLREATAYEQAPRFLIRDNEGKFGRQVADAADGAGIDVVTIPPNSPNVAVGHQILEIAFYIMRDGVTYEELGADYFNRRYAEKAVRRHVRQLEALGFHVTIEKAA